MSFNSKETTRFPIPTQTRLENLEIITVESFVVKPVGTRTQNTLVESDSLSSFSLPEETSNRKVVSDGKKRDGGGEGDVLGGCSGQRRRGEVVIDIDDLGDDKVTTEPTQIEDYLKFMYNICASPYNPAGNGGKGSKSMLDKVWSVMQKGCFAMFAGLSVIQAILDMKIYFLFNLVEGGLENFTDLALFIMNTCMKIYYVYQLVQQQTKMARMINSFQKLRKLTGKNTKRSNNKSHFPTKLGITTVIFSLIQTLCVEWTLKLIILHYSFHMSAGLYLWKPESFEERIESLYDQIEEEDLTKQNILLGLCAAIMNFCSSMHVDVAVDLMLVTAKTLKQEIGDLEAKINDPKNSVSNVTLEEFQSETDAWAHYRVLKQAVNNTNDAFDSLLKYMHVDNLMRCVYFVMNVFDGEFSFISSLGFVYTILKSSYTYRCATDASRFNENGRDWVRQLAMKSEDKKFLLKAAFIMDELEKQPLGLGRGQFLINESFLFRFLGSVGSVFVLQAQSRTPTVASADATVD